MSLGKSPLRMGYSFFWATVGLGLCSLWFGEIDLTLMALRSFLANLQCFNVGEIRFLKERRDLFRTRPLACPVGSSAGASKRDTCCVFYAAGLWESGFTDPTGSVEGGKKSGSCAVRGKQGKHNGVD